MQARDILKKLRNTKVNDEITLPMKIIGDDMPEDEFFALLKLRLSKIKPSLVYVNEWPDIIMSREQIGGLLKFLSENVSCKIYFDFSEKPDAWIQLFYAHTVHEYKELKTKPALSCIAPHNYSRTSWVQKFAALKLSEEATRELSAMGLSNCGMGVFSNSQIIKPKPSRPSISKVPAIAPIAEEQADSKRSCEI